MWSSGRIGTATIDPDRLTAELAQLAPSDYLDSYTEFVCGSWRTCMLWNASGEAGDVVIRDYDGLPQPTEAGRKLSYLDELLHIHFDLDRLRFARLARLGPGSVVVPHRDYVELGAELFRVHVPVRTNPDSYASEEQTIYRMGLGEIWFLDATRTHSIANFAGSDRIHLLLDFGAPERGSPLLGGGPAPAGLPPEAVVPRRPLRPDEPAAFQALAGLIDRTNLMDVMAMLIKRYFVAEIPVRDVFGWLTEIATGSGDPVLADRARWLERHALTSR